MNQYYQTCFDELLAWSQQHGAELHPSLEIYNDHVSKFSIRVKDSASDGLEPGFRAVTCPVPTTLSYLNALVDGPINLSESSPPPQQAPAFPPRFMQSFPPHVVGRYFLIKEYLKGKHSFWWPYIRTLPPPEQTSAWALPAFWPDDDIAYLEGTNAHVAIDEIQANVRREFKQARKLLMEEKFPNFLDFTPVLYRWAFCIFTSRSFRPSLILSDAAKQHASSLLLPEGCQLDDFSILQPLFDIANHSMTARYAWDTAADPNACQLICRDAYQPGDQVYNNYGLKTNSELLLGYGFILPGTPALHNDYVHVRKRHQPEEADASQTDDDDDTKPKDFLISLRPTSHASSLVSRSRLSHHSPGRRRPPSRLASLPYFLHFEPALVDDLASALVASDPEQRARWERWDRDDDHSDPANNNSAPPPPPPEFMDLVERVRGMLGGKLQYDYQRLKAVELGGEGEGEGEGEKGALPPPKNRNQVLAVEYRGRCEKVLVAALEGLMGGEGAEGGEDGSGSAS
ncbi:hypothetical protein C8A00DRAFT_35015 [Chaetomidium leptoderma]|uniref:SET domain-containing protein n=1 Tax=Chaetomidium leptoderma TaxID=669021 RepID=A0AAN6VJA8_9PEZI|nr:hypothetical protein C8A00DRAFT_35015 [Chaetomidium leptoderma]